MISIIDLGKSNMWRKSLFTGKEEALTNVAFVKYAGYDTSSRIIYQPPTKTVAYMEISLKEF